MPQLETVICLYRVKEGSEAEFEMLLERHWPTLRRLDLVTDEPPQHYRGAEEGNGKPLYVEIFSWASVEAASVAHEHPDVIAIWEPMDKLCEARDGRPSMEFPHVRLLRPVERA